MEFKVGDKVKGRVEGKTFTGIITHLESTNLTIKRDDNRFGSGEVIDNEGNQGWLTNKRIGGGWEYDLVKLKPLKPTKRKKIYIAVERDKTKICLSIKIPEEMEMLFKTMSKGQVAESNCWFNTKTGKKGKEFYMISSTHKGKIRELLPISIIDNFGNGLTDRGSINLAPLRCIGASKGTKLYSSKFDTISNIEFEHYIKELGSITKAIWENLISNSKLRAIITFELE